MNSDFNNAMETNNGCSAATSSSSTTTTDPNHIMIPRQHVLPVITLKNEHCQCQLYQFGAHIVSFTVDGVEQLWLSSLSPMDGSAPICGGIPIAFPQFADEGKTSKFHGFAQEREWTIDILTKDSIVLFLYDNLETRAIFPHSFALEYSVKLLERGIRMELRVMNADRTNPLEFSGCLHTYFRFEDTSRVELLGFRNAAFIDKADGRQQKIQKGPINIETEAMRTAKSSGAKYGYVHRVYHQNPGTFEFKNLATRKVLIKVTHSKSWPDTTVYNPWLGDKQGMEKGPDFDDDGYTKTISLEPTISGDHAVKLAPGESWVGYQQIEVPLNDDAAKSLHKRSYSTEKSTR